MYGLSGLIVDYLIYGQQPQCCVPRILTLEKGILQIGRCIRDWSDWMPKIKEEMIRGQS